MVNITENAAKAVRAAMLADSLSPGETYLRVAVKDGGCSGLSYELKFDQGTRAGDVVVEKDVVRLVIDVKSQIFLAGTTLDYSSGLNGRGFLFSNPNAAGTSGCGSSFGV